MTRFARLPRPRRAAVPLIGSAVTMAVWAAVARDSGVGWVQTLGALVAGLLAVGLAGPAVAVARVRCAVAAAPVDAAAGVPFEMQLTVRGAAELRPLRPSGSETLSGRRGGVTLTVVPAHRGPIDRCIVEVASAAPFGILWWSRRVELALLQPVLVAPRTGPPDQAIVHGITGEELASVVPGRGTELRGVRPYAHGDRRHLVHWPATAHTGALMVREHDRPADRWALVQGTLPDEARAAEAQAERVLGTVARLLESGARVQLGTTEPGGDVLAPVESVVAAGRRLALALPRVPMGGVDAAGSGRGPEGRTVPDAAEPWASRSR